MKHRAIAVVTVTLAVSAVLVQGASASSRAYPRDGALRVNQMQVLGTHNSYHVRPPRQLVPNEPADYEHPALDAQLAQGIRSLEIDVQNGPGFPVYHSIIVDQASSCPTLVACLTTIEQWSRANPGHAPLTIFLELKQLPTNSNAVVQKIIDDFVNQNGLAPWNTAALDRLDATVRQAFKRDLVTPDEVRGKHETLRSAITSSGWPTLGKTRGRVLVIFNSETMRATYLEGTPSLQGRPMFVIAPDATSPSAAFVSVAVPDSATIKPLLQQHMIVRTHADADAVEARANDLTRAAKAIQSGAQVVATDYPVPDPTIGPYVVRLPTTAVARCDPVTAPKSCQDREIENPKGLKKP
jgi:hypothetical protein